MQTSVMPPLPRLENIDRASIISWANAVVDSIEQQMQRMNAPGSTAAWEITGVTPAYTFDAAAATLADTRQALGTLLTDLKNNGITG